MHLSKLATHSTSGKLLGVAISEEATGVGYNLLDVETGSLVLACLCVGDIDKEWSSQAAIGHTSVVWSLGVGEGKARRSSLALHTLVDMCGCNCG